MKIPRDGANIYSKAAGTTAEPNETITSSQFNNSIDDLVTDANTARPITAGGTGGTTAATARTNLDVARQQSSTSNFTEGRGLIVGAGGLMGVALTHGVANLNDLITGHSWNISTVSGISNVPSADTGILTVELRAANRYVQTYRTTSAVAPATYQRSYNGTSWSAWHTICLVETGENADGRYTKYSDGRLECWSRVTSTDAINDAYEGGFQSSAFGAGFPFDFVEQPDDVQVSVASGSAPMVQLISATATGFFIRWLSFASQSSATRRACIYAYGRWE